MHAIFIAAAAVVGLPILLHLLLRQQPKKLIFPALRFLKLRQKSSSRKVQLRHILLLLLRCLLLALFALALYQPTISQIGTINLSGEQPAAVVIIIDTSPSTGYQHERTGPTRLDEARRRATDLLNELPANSRVAVVVTHNPTGEFQKTVPEARQQLDLLKQPSGSGRSLADALKRAYELLADVDAGRPEGAEPTPKLIAVFGDRATASWKDASGLTGLRDGVPQPAPVHLFFDVGTDTPTNLAVTDVRMASDRLPGAADAVLTAFVRADGLDVNGLEVTAQLDDGPTETAVLNVGGGTTQQAKFTFKAPAPGFHTVVVKHGRVDALEFDNERTFAIEVQPRRPILCIADDPADARLWRLAHNDGKREFDCTVTTPDKLPPLGGFEMVAVIAVASPSNELATTLTKYVIGGGKLFLAPDGPNSTDNLATAYEPLGDLLPAKLGGIKTLSVPDDKNRRFQVPWKIDDEDDLRPRFFAPIRDWQKQRNVDIFVNRPQAKKARSVTPVAIAEVIARYDDADTPADRTPALVQRTYEKGKVLLATSRLDDGAGEWNDTWNGENSWGVVLPWLVATDLCDDDATKSADGESKRRYNFATGEAEVKVPVRGFTPPGERKVRLEGPGVAADKSKFTVPPDATEITLRNKPKKPPRDENGQPVPPPPGVWELEGDPLLQPGVFTLRPDGGESPWQFRFSLAVPGDESDLGKVPPQGVDELFGPKSVVPLDQKVALADVLKAKLTQPFELFYPLILLVLLIFAFEGVMANRFYKLK